jgi:hypothetical protein
MNLEALPDCNLETVKRFLVVTHCNLETVKMDFW